MKGNGALAVAVIFVLLFFVALMLGWATINWNAITAFFGGLFGGAK